MKLWTVMLALIVLVGTTCLAQALPIRGSYALTVDRVTTDTVDLSAASQIYFSGSSLTPANVITSFTPSPGFTPSTVNACLICGSISNITGLPSGNNTSPFTQINNLFSAQGLTFNLNALTSVLRTTTASDSSLVIAGNGVYSASGFDDTPGNFIMTLQNGSATIMVDSASASGSTTAIPEPASLALLGLGVAGIVAVRRRRAG